MPAKGGCSKDRLNRVFGETNRGAARASCLIRHLALVAFLFLILILRLIKKDASANRRVDMGCHGTVLCVLRAFAGTGRWRCE
jgi:hypothetical protein